MVKPVFVFSTNEAGAHGAGSAKYAYEKRGARWGFSYGHMGESFAIPVKDEFFDTISIDRIERYIQGFIAYAQGHRKVKFQITRIGSELSGHKDHLIALMFKDAPANCEFDEHWEPWLGKARKYWGTHE